MKIADDLPMVVWLKNSKLGLPDTFSRVQRTLELKPLGKVTVTVGFACGDPDPT